MIITEFIFVLVLGFIAINDFKRRTFPLWSFLLLLSIIVFRTHFYTNYKILLINTSINISILLLQALVLIIYFKFYKKTEGQLINKLIGNGDLLFYIALAFCAEPFNFLYFQTISLLLVLTSFWVLSKFRIVKSKLIPLAGGISLSLMLCSIVSIITGYNWQNTPLFILY